MKISLQEEREKNPDLGSKDDVTDAMVDEIFHNAIYANMDRRPLEHRILLDEKSPTEKKDQEVKIYTSEVFPL